MRNWERPMVVVDTFAANEFVSTCHEQNMVYKFKCDAGDERSRYSSFIDSNNNDKLDDSDTQIGRSYHPCGKKHDAKTKDVFYNGFIVNNRNHRDVIPVIIWRGKYNNNVHCTTNLQMNTWETEKS